MKTNHPSIPSELLKFIVYKQTIINDNWLQDQIAEYKVTNKYRTDKEEENEPPSPKRKKIT